MTKFLKENKRIFFALTALLFFFLSANISQAIIAPQVNITDIQIEKENLNGGETMKGQASLENFEPSVMSDLSLQYQLWFNERNNVPLQMIDRKEGKSKLSLTPGEKRNIPFSYEIPKNLPTNSPIFRIQLVNGKGEEMGWMDKHLNISAKDAFLTLDNSWIAKDGQNLSSSAGVYYKPEENSVQFHFDITNSSSPAINVVPVVTNYKRNIGGEIASEIKENPISFSAGEKRTYSVTLPKQEVPGTYLSEVRLRDPLIDEYISNAIDFRWIISGEDTAQIIYSATDKNSYQAGDNATINVSFIGTADDSLNEGTGEIIVSLYNNKNEIVGSSRQTVDLADVNQQTINCVVEKNVDHPTVDVQIAKDGKIINSYKFGTENSEKQSVEPEQKKPTEAPAPKTSKKWSYIAIGILLLLLITIAVYKYIRYRNWKDIIHPLLLVALSGIGFLFFSANASAATEAAWDPEGTTLIWNSPLPNQYFHVGDPFTFQGKYRVTSCGDGLFNNKVDFFITNDEEIPLKRTNRCDVQNVARCADIMVVDESSPSVYKLTTTNPEQYQDPGIWLHWVPFNETFTIPSSFSAKPVRFYAQYSGTHWWDHWHWSVAYQKSIVYNSIADFSVDFVPETKTVSENSDNVIILQRNENAKFDIPVTLSSSDPSKVSVPATAVFLKGTKTLTIPIHMPPLDLTTCAISPVRIFVETSYGNDYTDVTVSKTCSVSCSPEETTIDPGDEVTFQGKLNNFDGDIVWNLSNTNCVESSSAPSPDTFKVKTRKTSLDGSYCAMINVSAVASSPCTACASTNKCSIFVTRPGWTDAN